MLVNDSSRASLCSGQLLVKPGLHDALLLKEQFVLLFKLFKLGFRHGLDPWGTDALRV